ncbi:MAG: D-glycero-beta-D-manno-heptose 1-phosphate adenylyltransferase [Gemmatimonadetes bacterium]|nr:D-glycero-beta-D-manno-heptose 1-phosphate adenylyltransferase [Gemmatimonadota bacterium]
MSGSSVRSPQSKVLTRAELLARFGRPRPARVVFTNGCFDLLHRGHVEVLFRARELGDMLVVGLNSDASVRRLKGAGRPLVAQEDRAAIVAALACVDVVTIFDEDTPRELVAALLPDVLVKGGDYRPQDVVGATEVEAAGGRVVILPYLEGRSTTDLIRRIAQAP